MACTWRVMACYGMYGVSWRSMACMTCPPQSLWSGRPSKTNSPLPKSGNPLIPGIGSKNPGKWLALVLIAPSSLVVRPITRLPAQFPFSPNSHTPPSGKSRSGRPLPTYSPPTLPLPTTTPLGLNSSPQNLAGNVNLLYPYSLPAQTPFRGSSQPGGNPWAPPSRPPKPLRPKLVG